MSAKITLIIILVAAAMISWYRKDWRWHGLVDLLPSGRLPLVPGIIALVVLIVYLLSPRFRFAHDLSQLLTGWFH
jgi:hypothetical protein